MKIVFLPQAVDELEEAVAFYEDKQSGLGGRLRDEVERTLCWIIGHANIPRLRGAGYRRVNLRVFPYYVTYVDLEQSLWILAVAHGHRKPEFWIDRARNIKR